VFNGTNLNYVLNNLGIRTLVIAGVVTSGCVELAVRDASDLGFAVVVVEDATATWSAEMQAGSMRAMREIYAKVELTDEVVPRVGVGSPVMAAA
jgi:nicotinamidase-related amidase